MNTPRSRRSGTLVRLLRSTVGNAGIEFALIAPFLIALAAGSFDFGRGFIEQKRLASAAHAGAQYAFQHASGVANPSDVSPVIQSARNDANDTANALNVTASYFCECGGAAALCGTPCAGGDMPELYITVDAERNLDLLFSYPGIADPMPLRKSITMRLR